MPKGSPTGLKVEINLWPIAKNPEFDANTARVFLKGTATPRNKELKECGKQIVFNDPGQLLSLLGRLNVELMQVLR